jgi:hypothetical protein
LSHSWGEWGGSYKIEAAPADEPRRSARRSNTLHGYGVQPVVPAPPGVHASIDLTQYRGQASKTFIVQVTGSTDGIVWGDEVYTDDSTLAAAAVHAGILKPGEQGFVAITTLPGQKSYRGSDKNGVSSRPYAEWYGSFTIEKANGIRLTEPVEKSNINLEKLDSYTFGLQR